MSVFDWFKTPSLAPAHARCRAPVHESASAYTRARERAARQRIADCQVLHDAPTTRPHHRALLMELVLESLAALPLAEGDLVWTWCETRLHADPRRHADALRRYSVPHPGRTLGEQALCERVGRLLAALRTPR